VKPPDPDFIIGFFVCESSTPVNQKIIDGLEHLFYHSSAPEVFFRGNLAAAAEEP
jgi:hypothetical protein